MFIIVIIRIITFFSLKHFLFCTENVTWIYGRSGICLKKRHYVKLQNVKCKFLFTSLNSKRQKCLKSNSQSGATADVSRSVTQKVDHLYEDRSLHFTWFEKKTSLYWMQFKSSKHFGWLLVFFSGENQIIKLRNELNICLNVYFPPSDDWASVQQRAVCSHQQPSPRPPSEASIVNQDFIKPF